MTSTHSIQFQYGLIMTDIISQDQFCQGVSQSVHGAEAVETSILTVDILHEDMSLRRRVYAHLAKL